MGTSVGIGNYALQFAIGNYWKFSVNSVRVKNFRKTQSLGGSHSIVGQLQGIY